MTGISLFSRAHKPRGSPPKKMRGFLALPGEIRNQIYGYYFDSERRCEIASKGSKFTQRKPQTVKLSSNVIATNSTTPAPDPEMNATPPVVIRFSRSLGKYKAVQGLRTNWPGSLCALSLVCKQVYAETVKLLYQNTTFVFDAPKRMTNFFKYASSIHLGSITRLHLHYSTYGNPNKTVDVVWQEKHHQSWQRACEAASKQLTGLRELEVCVELHHGPRKISLREKWMTPLLQFRRLASPKKAARRTVEPPPLDQRQPGLLIVKVKFQHLYANYASYTGLRGLDQAKRELYLLFGQAISLAITGATEEAALSGFREAYEGRHAQYQPYLPSSWAGP